MHIANLRGKKIKMLISGYIGSWENHSCFKVKPKSNIWHLYKKRKKNTETHIEAKATYKCMKFKVAVPIDEKKRGPPEL